ncbi:hypothetical protein JW979_11485 [bacterium]|nr:hypothetical protein [candidate division CSSED10-310 bacterium]
MTKHTVRPKYSEIVKRFSDLNTIIIGDLMVDKYIWGKGIRLSTEAAVPVIKVDHEDYSLGGAANIAFHLANLKAKAYLCGLVGYDDAAHHLRTQISHLGIDVGGIFPSNFRPTTQKIRIMSVEHSQILGRYDYEKDDPQIIEETAPMIKYVQSYASDMNLMILSDYGRGVFKSVRFFDALKKLHQEYNILTVAQCRTESLMNFNWVDHLVISSWRAREYLNRRKIKKIKNIEDIGAKLVHLMPLKYLTIYDFSERCISIFDTNGKLCATRHFQSQVQDQTGLGDVATVMVALAFAVGCTPFEAIELAIKGTRATAQQIGTGKLAPEDLIK